jgi:hypothetical protein
MLAAEDFRRVDSFIMKTNVERVVFPTRGSIGSISFYYLLVCLIQVTLYAMLHSWLTPACGLEDSQRLDDIARLPYRIPTVFIDSSFLSLNV